MSLGRNRFCGTFPLFQCTSLATFAAYQGLPLVLAGLAVLLGLRRARRAEDGPPPDAALPRALAFSTVALVASLFVMDFLNGRSGPATWLQIWLKSRLVEPWFYGTLVVALAAVWSRAGTGGRRAVAAALVLFLVLRHALSPGGGIVGQIAANGAYLAAHLR
jgi:hypothetical protein